MSGSMFYRTVAADLDRFAADLDDCASSVIAPAARRLPNAVLGAATPYLQSEYERAVSNIQAGAGAVRTAAAWARAEADRIDAAAAATAAAAAAAPADEGTSGDGGPEDGGGPDGGESAGTTAPGDQQPVLYF